MIEALLLAAPATALFRTLPRAQQPTGAGAGAAPASEPAPAAPQGRVARRRTSALAEPIFIGPRPSSNAGKIGTEWLRNPGIAIVLLASAAQGGKISKRYAYTDDKLAQEEVRRMLRRPELAKMLLAVAQQAKLVPQDVVATKLAPEGAEAEDRLDGSKGVQLLARAALARKLGQLAAATPGEVARTLLAPEVSAAYFRLASGLGLLIAVPAGSPEKLTLVPASHAAGSKSLAEQQAALSADTLGRHLRASLRPYDLAILTPTAIAPSVAPMAPKRLLFSDVDDDASYQLLRTWHESEGPEARAQLLALSFTSSYSDPQAASLAKLGQQKRDRFHRAARSLDALPRFVSLTERKPGVRPNRNPVHFFVHTPAAVALFAAEDGQAARATLRHLNVDQDRRLADKAVKMVGVAEG